VTGRGRRLALRAGVLVVLLGATRDGLASPSPTPEPTPPFGRVVYRIAKAASFESLGVMMIACRHRDPVPRRFAVEFWTDQGRRVQSFGQWSTGPVPAGKKVVFVGDGMHFANRPDVLDFQLGHFSIGAGWIASDARVVHCIGKIRMDGGVRQPSYREEIGLVRAGEPLPDLARSWGGPPTRR
jgi:hypothetical protein